MPEERELEGLRREIEALADCLDDLGDDLDSTAVAGILRGLLNGETADAIIADYALTDPGV